jgi:5-methylcytosine-specific restriction endonuclease McrA
MEQVRAEARAKREHVKPKGVGRGNGRKAVINTRAYTFSVGRLARQYAKRCSLKVETARWRIRYEYDADFKAKTIERVHRKNTARKAHIAMVDDGTLTGPAIRSLFASAKQCRYCERPMRSKDKTLDHVIPLSRGGMHSIHNAAIACHSCNTGKGGRTPEEWRSGTVSRRRAA